MKKLLLAAIVTSCAYPPVRQVAQFVPEDLQLNVECSSEYGRALFALDRASWLGAQAYLQHTTDDERQRANLGGYLAIPNPGDTGYVVYFFTKDEPPLVKFEARVTAGAKQLASFQKLDQPATEERLARLVAVQKVALEGVSPLAKKPNPLVLLAGCLGHAQGDFVVEMLAPPEHEERLMLGRHTRVIVSSEGQIVSTEPLSREQELPLYDAHGVALSSLTLESDVADYPLETHVFESMFAQLPIFVITPRGKWLVDRDQITFLEGRGQQ
jgi:hypothetical protein